MKSVLSWRVIFERKLERKNSIGTISALLKRRSSLFSPLQDVCNDLLQFTRELVLFPTWVILLHKVDNFVKSMKNKNKVGGNSFQLNFWPLLDTIWPSCSVYDDGDPHFRKRFLLSAGIVQQVLLEWKHFPWRWLRQFWTSFFCEGFFHVFTMLLAWMENARWLLPPKKWEEKERKNEPLAITETCPVTLRMVCVSCWENRFYSMRAYARDDVGWWWWKIIMWFPAAANINEKGCRSLLWEDF